MLLLLSFCYIITLQSQEAFLVRQTLSSNGASVSLNNGSDHLVVQQSIGQSSVSGKGTSHHTLLRQGFIQAPLGTNFKLKLSELQISNYPNPFYDRITVDWSEETLREVKVILRDCTGKVVLETACSGMNHSYMNIETHHLSAGSYILQVTSDDRVYTSKLIKL